MNSIHLDFAAAIFALVILIVYSIFVLEWLVYRALILQNFQQHIFYNTNEGRVRHLRSPLHPAAASAPLHFEPYDTPHPFTPPLPKWIAAIAFSRGGRWMPADKRKSFGVLVSPLKPSHTHWWLAMPLLTIFTTLLSSLPATSTVGCDALQGIITTASAAMSVALVAVRPHRALIVSIVAAASLIVVAATSALGLACRHGLVSLDELLSVCSALSYVTLVGKVYVALLPSFENKILQRRLPRFSLENTFATLSSFQGIANEQHRKRDWSIFFFFSYVTLVGKVYVALLPSFENKILERRLPRLSLQNNTFATLSSFQSIANEQHRKRDWSIHRERQHVGLTRLVKNICWHVKNNQVPSLAKQELTGQRLENCFEFGRLT
ncbi:membrane-associated protein, putative [Bodo saltans]|uniref:Membrane-associated protein, putative n=1 Tax=Bodo saltans TaxID=75058 RepID=A0A0S4JBK1_BODSA|nr:membrane-associated protein, putative [Bodo saltans]|eukprot:CUG86538.1 membrane-associated protein, putative [Bodo saltans]